MSTIETKSGVEADGENVATRAAVSTGSEAVKTFVMVVFNAITWFAIARYLGADQFGQYVLVTFVANFVSLIPAARLDKLVVREITQGTDEREILGNVIVVQLGLAVGATALNQLILLGIGLAKGEISWAIQLGGLLASAMFFTDSLLTVFAVFQARLKSQWEALARIASVTVKTIIVFALIIAGAPMWTFLGALPAGQVVAIFVAYYVVRRKFGIWPHWTTARTGWILRQAVPLGLGMLLAMGWMQFDTVMVSIMRSNAETAYYGGVMQLIQYSMLAGGIIALVMFPILSTHWGRDHQRFDNVNRGTFDTAFVVYLPVAVILWCIDLPAFLEKLYGPGYGQAATAFRLLSVALIFMTVVAWQSFVLLAADRQRLTVWVNALGLLLTVVMNLIFIPTYGISGAAFASAITMFTTMVVALVVTWKVAHTRPGIGRLLRTLVANALLLVGLWQLAELGVGNLGLIAIAVVAYLPLLLICGVVRPSMLHVLRNRPDGSSEAHGAQGRFLGELLEEEDLTSATTQSILSRTAEDALGPSTHDMVLEILARVGADRYLNPEARMRAQLLAAGSQTPDAAATDLAEEIIDLRSQPPEEDSPREESLVEVDV